MIVGLVFGLIVVIAGFIFVPFIAGTMESSMPALAVDSDWNRTHNTNMPDVPQMWATWGGLISLAIIALMLAIAILYIRGMQKGG